METTDICRLNRDVLTKMLADRAAAEPHSHADGKRLTARWPFPGTVELWAPESTGRQWYALATSVNLSTSGIGLHCDEPLKRDEELEIAIHEPEMSFHGRAVVRHCTEMEGGAFMVGMQFLYEDE